MAPSDASHLFGQDHSSTVPIRLWGAMVAGISHDKRLPPETDSRLGQFTDLMATAIANTEARREVERLAEERATLRHVATLVAQGASPGAVLAAVAAEMERLLTLTKGILDLAIAQDVGRPREQEPTRRRILVDRLLDRQQQIGDTLHLVDQDGSGETGDETGRIGFSGRASAPLSSVKMRAG